MVKLSFIYMTTVYLCLYNIVTSEFHNIHFTIIVSDLSTTTMAALYVYILARTADLPRETK